MAARGCEFYLRVLSSGCYTTVDCDSENTGFLTRAHAARFQG